MSAEIIKSRDYSANVILLGIELGRYQECLDYDLGCCIYEDFVPVAGCPIPACHNVCIDLEQGEVTCFDDMGKHFDTLKLLDVLNQTVASKDA